MLSTCRALYYDLLKAPFRTLKLVVLIAGSFVLCNLVLGIFWSEARPIVFSLFCSYMVLVLGLVILLLTRLYGKLRDVHAAISLYHNVPRGDHIVGGLFIDGAAANASLLLFLVKFLNMCTPRRILELGSGQTTKLFASYYHSTPDVTLCTLEHNEAWIRELKPLITRNGKCPDYHYAPLIARDFACAGTGKRIRTHWYTAPESLRNHRFDLILVDGPDTGPGSAYTREGVLEHIPGILAERFVVVFDDAERADEMALVTAFQRMLQAHRIRYVRFEIEAVKTQSIFCSPELAFLRSV